MKISVVMQTYLGDYPRARKRPIEKFHRAVKSFLSQSYENSELVIVSDGCSITTDIFNSQYSSNERIKFVYLHKREKNMYEEIEPGKNYFRGIPKRVGVAASSGDLITYMDADDIILKDRLKDISEAWVDKSYKVLWSNNPMRWYNHCHFRNRAISHLTMEESNIDLSEFNIKSKYLLNKTSIVNGAAITLGAPWAFTHRKQIPVIWEDTIGISEDNLFNQRLVALGGGFIQESPTYVVCHCSNYWGRMG